VVILGVADGLDSGAALVVGERPVAATTQASLDRAARSKEFPWAAMTDVLEAAGLSRADVDLVAVAGRYTPPLILRRFPQLRRVAGDNPFSPALDAHIAYQAALRWTGFGAFQEDMISEWFHRQLVRRGYDPRRVVMVDMHRALADAVYRSQPHDRVLAITAHPKADGASLAVHQGLGGMLRPRFRDSAMSVLHTHLQRCVAAAGFTPVLDHPLIWAEAARGTPDPKLVQRLGRRLTSVGRRPSRRAYPVPDDLPLRHSTYDALRETDPQVAAASLLENLVEALGGVVRAHVLRNGAKRVVLGGSLFDNPRLVARIAESVQVESLFVLPDPGARSLPLGAATDQAGIGPRRMAGPGLGRSFSAHQCALALSAAALEPHGQGQALDLAAQVIAEGGAVARFQGPGGAGWWGGGARSVLVRADMLDVVQSTARALERDPREEPGCVWDGVTGGLIDEGPVKDCVRLGSVALKVDAAFAKAHPAVIAKDGRALVKRVCADDEPELAELLERVRERCGCGALAALPLGIGREPPSSRPGDAVRLWRQCGLDALLLGPYLLRKRGRK
jgi:carbamoyltransferase